jgi:hypothetical protein
MVKKSGYFVNNEAEMRNIVNEAANMHIDN